MKLLKQNVNTICVRENFHFLMTNDLNFFKTYVYDNHKLNKFEIRIYKNCNAWYQIRNGIVQMNNDDDKTKQKRQHVAQRILL